MWRERFFYIYNLLYKERARVRVERVKKAEKTREYLRISKKSSIFAGAKQKKYERNHFSGRQRDAFVSAE